MQKVLENAAKWYIEESGFTLERMQHDLDRVLAHREKAMHSSDIEYLNKAFIYTEIIKAAICLTTGREYPTAFSKFELGLIRKYTNPRVVQEYFTCSCCGKEYPASAFKNSSLYSGKRYCLACAKYVQRVYKQAQVSGYVDHKGAIICSC
jgi:hypothetical protein